MMRNIVFSLATLLLAGCVSVDLGGSADRPVSYVMTDARPSMRPADSTLPVSLIVQGLAGDPMSNSLSIAYSLAPNQRELYQLSRWTERPVHALPRLLIQRLDARGAFQAVAGLGEGVGGELGLGIVIESIYHDVIRDPGHVALSVRADLVDRNTRALRARRTFTTEVPLAELGPAAVVDAMAIAVANVFDELIPWLEAEAAAE